MKNFILIGAGGYVAPKHLRAIRDTGNTLLAALDKNDSVGILDSYFPAADFFTEYERFDRHVEKLKRHGTRIDYLAVCSPNYLHDSHIRFGLRLGTDVICEKPLVLNPWNVDALMDMERETGSKVFTLLQLRLHPSIVALKRRVNSEPGKRYSVELRYITPRGNWYQASWKGDITKSGGIATNIGLHFFDMLLWVFGDVSNNTVIEHTQTKASGSLQLERADVNWFLSIDHSDLPGGAITSSFRSLKIDDQRLEFSDGFDSLHSEAYEQIIAGNGVALSETRKAIALVHDIRKAHT